MALIQWASERNIKWNRQNIQFKLSKIAFMGAIYSEDGVSPDPGKVRAVIEMPILTDKPSVVHFCGLVNYLSNFCPNLSTVIKPLYDLSKKDQEFLWSSESI